MVIKVFKNFFKRIFSNIFKDKREVKLGFYGPPNVGKTSLANRICKDFTGEGMGSVSKIPHETRNVQFKENITYNVLFLTVLFNILFINHR